jgi:nucleotide-binding universal stress UspA family protein
MVVVAAVDRVDGSDAVVTEALTLAEAFDEELHVVHSLTQGEFVDLERTSVERDGRAVDMDRIREIAASIATERVEAADAGGGERIRVVGLVGDPASEVLRHARETDARYIVVGGRKRSPVGKAVFGSVTQEVILNTDRPVLTVIDE